MADPLQVSIRVAAKVCMDHAHVLQQVATTPGDWPDGLERDVRRTLQLSEQMFAALVRLYLRTV